MQVWTPEDVAVMTAKKRTIAGDAGVRVSVSPPKDPTKNGARLRFAMTKEVWNFISTSLNDPRIKIEGSASRGFRLYCKDGDGYKPIIEKHSASVIVTAAMFGTTVNAVGSMKVEYETEYDEKGPTVRIARMPDEFLPGSRPVDRSDAAFNEKRQLSPKERRRKIAEEAFEAATVQPDPQAPSPAQNPGTSEVPEPPSVDPIPEPEPQPAPQPEPIEPPSEIPEKVQAYAVAVGTPVEIAEPDEHDQTVDDMREAIAMVNEMKERLGPSVMLYVDQDGQLRAKRRVIMYVEL